MTTSVSAVDTTTPAMRATASPWKIGSSRMTTPPTTSAAAVSAIGRNRTAAALVTAAASGSPASSSRLTKSTSRIELRTMIPARAMKPIIEVAVKKTPPKAWAGMIPISVSGIGAMMIFGVTNERNQPTTSR